MAVAHDTYAHGGGEPAARYAPVLAELVRAGILEKDDRGRWVLAGEAQTWLEAHSAGARPRPRVEARVAVGLRCQRCGESGLTSMADGRRLCASCKANDGYVDAEPLPQLRPRRAP